MIKKKNSEEEEIQLEEYTDFLHNEKIRRNINKRLIEFLESYDTENTKDISVYVDDIIYDFKEIIRMMIHMKDINEYIYTSIQYIVDNYNDNVPMIRVTFTTTKGNIRGLGYYIRFQYSNLEIPIKITRECFTSILKLLVEEEYLIFFHNTE